MIEKPASAASQQSCRNSIVSQRCTSSPFKLIKGSLFVILLAALLVLALSLTAKDQGKWKDLYVKVGDLKIHYIEAGSGDRPLVFIPGWLMTAEVWQEQIPYFSSRGWHVIAYDPRGQGFTTKTEGGNTYHQHAADLNAFLKKLKLEDPCLVGWSAGVSTLLDFMAASETVQPDKVVFVDGMPAGFKSTEFPWGKTMEQARAITINLQEDREKAIDKYVRSLFKETHPGWIFKDLIKGGLRTPMEAAISLYMDQFTGDRSSALARVSVPTLIVTIPENRLAGEYMQSKIPGARLEVIEGAGHALFLDKPQAFNQILESFLEAQ
jgi:non-heme chloroperoxidase